MARSSKPKSRWAYRRRTASSDGSGPRKPRKQVYGESSLLRLAVLGAAWVFIGLVLFVGYCALTLPDIADAAAFKRKPSIVVLDANGSTLAEYGERTANPVTLDDVPQHLINALLAVEDRRFYTHWGFDPLGFARGVVINPIVGKRATGGSTITQQLAKNLFLTPERTLKRKVQELLLAFWLEYSYSKEEILEAYLNRVYFGAGAYGVEAAARTYFGKTAKRLNIRESALLMGLLKAPSRYSPKKNDTVEAEKRTKIVLAAMIDAGMLSEKDQKDLKDLPVVEANKLNITSEGRYFADWVLYQTQALLGDTGQDLIVRTTLDRAAQRAAENAIKTYLERDGEKQKVEQAAALLLARDGAVLAMVGGRNYGESQFNRAVQALRQPGSSFKPFVYLAALASGLSGELMFDDTLQSYGKWRPRNYDGEYRGPITMREALTHSVNTVAVQLLQQVGVSPVRSLASRMGITSPIAPELSIALGSSVVTLFELTSAYATIANEGRAVSPYAITEIRDSKGKILYKHRPVQMPRVVDDKPVRYLTSMMMDVIKKGTGMAAAIGRPAAGKTGTSSDYRDAWFMGFTAHQTLGVWVGNDDNTPMAKVTGGGMPARIWRDTMAAAEAKFAPEDLSTPIILFDEIIPGIFGNDKSAPIPQALPSQIDEEAPIIDNSIAVEEDMGEDASVGEESPPAAAPVDDGNFGTMMQRLLEKAE